MCTSSRLRAPALPPPWRQRHRSLARRQRQRSLARRRPHLRPPSRLPQQPGCRPSTTQCGTCQTAQTSLASGRGRGRKRGSVCRWSSPGADMDLGAPCGATPRGQPRSKATGRASADTTCLRSRSSISDGGDAADTKEAFRLARESIHCHAQGMAERRPQAQACFEELLLKPPIFSRISGRWTF